jgi:hypothetical protein
MTTMIVSRKSSLKKISYVARAARSIAGSIVLHVVAHARRCCCCCCCTVCGCLSQLRCTVMCRAVVAAAVVSIILRACGPEQIQPRSRERIHPGFVVVGLRVHYSSTIQCPCPLFRSSKTPSQRRSMECPRGKHQDGLLCLACSCEVPLLYVSRCVVKLHRARRHTIIPVSSCFSVHVGKPHDEGCTLLSPLYHGISHRYLSFSSPSSVA